MRFFWSFRISGWGEEVLQRPELLACDGAFISLVVTLFLLLSWLLIANFSVRFLGSLVIKVLVVEYFKRFRCRKNWEFRIGRR